MATTIHGSRFNSTPVGASGHYYPSSSRPSLVQSSTQSSKPMIAKVLNGMNRMAAKVKRSKKHNKSNKKVKKQAPPPSATDDTRPSSVIPRHRSNNVPTNTEDSKSKVKTKSKKTKKGQNNSDSGIDERALHTIFAARGFSIVKKLADTLQGQIYRCRSTTNQLYFGRDTVVIKVTRQDLHREGMTILDSGHKKEIQENILKERDMIEELTKSEDDRNRFITRFVDFFETSDLYFLVLEDGESDLFEYVVRCHNLIRKGHLQRKEWRLMCKKLFKQIVQLLDFLHSQHSMCHLDISLENMLIQNGSIFQNVNTSQITLNREVQIKFCDFGLAEKFDAQQGFACTKYVGKTRYKSPELWTKKLVFDARATDIWSLGISLFMMILGVPPVKYPERSDENFKLIIDGQVLQLIQSWNRAKYMTPQILDLLESMLKPESQRITLQDIKKHSWVKLAE